jgi:DNA replication protein DnaC
MDPTSTHTGTIGDTARRVLARKGINPDAVDTTTDSVAEFLTVRYQEKLTGITPKLFGRPQPTDRRVADWIASYLADPSSTPSLFLAGPVGSGKTHNGLAALWRIALTRAGRGRRFSFTKVSHSDFNQAMRPTQDGSHLGALAEFQTVDLLLFDDLGVGQLTEWSTDTLFRLIDTRWSEGRPMIFTSNKTAGELKAVLDDRIRSRLSAAAHVQLEDVDHRRAGVA